MKLTIPKAALSQALSAVSSVVGGRASLPYLQFAKLTTMDDAKRVSISATDLECFYTRVVEGDIDGPLSCLLPVGRVKEWLGLINNPVVILEAFENTIKLSTEGTGTLKLNAMPLDNFPKMEHDSPVHVAAADFAPIKHIAWSMMEANGAQPVLEAVFIEPHDKGIICASSDGRKVGTVEIDAEREMFSPISLPSRYVSMVSGLGHCQLLESKNSLHFRSPQFHLICRKTEHPVPAWRKMMFNSGFPVVGSITVMRDEMANAVAQCHVLRGGELGSEYGVRVSFGKATGGMNVSCFVEKTADSFSHTVEGRLRGEFPNIILSTEHITPFLNLPDESPLKIQFTSDRTIVYMNADDLKVNYGFSPMIQRTVEESK